MDKLEKLVSFTRKVDCDEGKRLTENCKGVVNDKLNPDKNIPEEVLRDRITSEMNSPEFLKDFLSDAQILASNDSVNAIYKSITPGTFIDRHFYVSADWWTTLFEKNTFANNYAGIVLVQGIVIRSKGWSEDSWSNRHKIIEHSGFDPGFPSVLGGRRVKINASVEVFESHLTSKYKYNKNLVIPWEINSPDFKETLIDEFDPEDCKGQYTYDVQTREPWIKKEGAASPEKEAVLKQIAEVDKNIQKAMRERDMTTIRTLMAEKTKLQTDNSDILAQANEESGDPSDDGFLTSAGKCLSTEYVLKTWENALSYRDNSSRRVTPKIPQDPVTQELFPPLVVIQLVKREIAKAKQRGQTYGSPLYTLISPVQVGDKTYTIGPYMDLCKFHKIKKEAIKFFANCGDNQEFCNSLEFGSMIRRDERDQFLKLSGEARDRFQSLYPMTSCDEGKPRPIAVFGGHELAIQLPKLIFDPNVLAKGPADKDGETKTTWFETRESAEWIFFWKTRTSNKEQFKILNEEYSEELDETPDTTLQMHWTYVLGRKPKKDTSELNVVHKRYDYETNTTYYVNDFVDWWEKLWALMNWLFYNTDNNIITNNSYLDFEWLTNEAKIKQGIEELKLLEPDAEITFEDDEDERSVEPESSWSKYQPSTKDIVDFGNFLKEKLNLRKKIINNYGWVLRDHILTFYITRINLQYLPYTISTADCDNSENLAFRKYNDIYSSRFDSMVFVSNFIVEYLKMASMRSPVKLIADNNDVIFYRGNSDLIIKDNYKDLDSRNFMGGFKGIHPEYFDVENLYSETKNGIVAKKQFVMQSAPQLSNICKFSGKIYTASSLGFYSGKIPKMSLKNFRDVIEYNFGQSWSLLEEKDDQGDALAYIWFPTRATSLFAPSKSKDPVTGQLLGAQGALTSQEIVSKINKKSWPGEKTFDETEVENYRESKKKIIAYFKSDFNYLDNIDGRDIHRSQFFGDGFCLSSACRKMSRDVRGGSEYSMGKNGIPFICHIKHNPKTFKYYYFKKVLNRLGDVILFEKGEPGVYQDFLGKLVEKEDYCSGVENIWHRLMHGRQDLWKDQSEKSALLAKNIIDLKYTSFLFEVIGVQEGGERGQGLVNVTDDPEAVYYTAYYLDFYGFGMPPAILNTVKDYFQDVLNIKENQRQLPSNFKITFFDKSVIAPIKSKPKKQPRGLWDGNRFRSLKKDDPCYKTSDGKLRRKTVAPFCTGPKADRDDCVWVGRGQGCRTKKPKFSFEDEELKLLQTGSTFYFASSSNMMLNDPAYNSKVFAQYMKDKKKINLYKFPGDALLEMHGRNRIYLYEVQLEGEVPSKMYNGKNKTMVTKDLLMKMKGPLLKSFVVRKSKHIRLANKYQINKKEFDDQIDKAFEKSSKVNLQNLAIKISNIL